MKITYLYHSGFLIETENIAIIIDFYKNFLPINDVVYKSNKKLYVISSHSHYDHFNQDILRWNKERRNLKYIFSKEIFDNYHIESNDIIYLDKADSYNDDDISITAFGSTDIGASFLIKIENKTIFHAGDLNNWHWMDESSEEEWKIAERHFIQELEEISEEYKYIDIVMFPVDPRLGKEYMRGAIQFVNEIKVENFIPMHFGEDYHSANMISTFCNNKGINCYNINYKGQEFII